jgi:endonuclease III
VTARRAPTIETIIGVAGRTFCEEAGFTLRNRPAPLYQLLVLATLVAKPISPALAIAGARELRKAGARTPDGMLRLSRQERVDALGRGRYRRYDESSATILEKSAIHVRDRYRGDLRRLATRAGEDVPAAHQLLSDVPGIGPAAADVFLREAQLVWGWARPYIDDRVLDGAARLGLTRSRAALTRHFARTLDPAGLAAALVRATIDEAVVEQIRNADRG